MAIPQPMGVIDDAVRFITINDRTKEMPKKLRLRTDLIPLRQVG